MDPVARNDRPNEHLDVKLFVELDERVHGYFEVLYLLLGIEWSVELLRHGGMNRGISVIPRNRRYPCFPTARDAAASRCSPRYGNRSSAAGLINKGEFK